MPTLARSLRFYILIIGFSEILAGWSNVTGTTELKLRDPNSTRLSISVLYSPNDSLLQSKHGKSVVPEIALKNFENEISDDYVFFNSTGKFPHKYCIQGFVCASDVIDYKTSKNQAGKNTLVMSQDK